MPTLILIVDDNMDDRDHYIRLLRKSWECDFIFQEAEGYDSMTRCLDQSMPNCMILDYSLPGMNGLEILKLLAAKYPFLPIIMMTGQGSEKVAAQAIKQGAQHYLIKSEITPETLHSNITNAIRHSAMAQERSQLIQKLMDSNTALERFAYVASHDLQEPIRMITNFGKLLMTEYSAVLDDTGKEYLTMVTDSGERMRDVVTDLLEYSRLGNENARIVAFEGELALNGALENLKALIEEQQAVITYDKLPELYGNPIQIMRLLQNLIANAIKYQPKGNIARIHISVRDAGTHLKLSVKDNGIGIDNNFIKQIFEPFRRLHTWDHIKGSGLGLAICKKIMENNNGTMEVSSIPGEGSLFTAILPKQPMEMQEAV